MPLTLRIESELDERSARESASRAERIYTDAARNMSSALGDGLTRGAREGGQAIERMANQARDSYGRVGDATEELRQQERLLAEMRAEGARGVEVQAERVRRARRAERDAIKEAAAAYDEYEQAARSAGNAGEEAGDSILAGLRGAAGGAASAGQEFAGGFAGGFAGASALTRITGAIPGLGWAAAGITAGGLLATGIAQGLQSLQIKDLFQARLGVDDGTMSQYGQAAASAYVDAWGESVADNLRTVQFAVQGGVVAPGASSAEIEQTIANMQALATMMEVDVQEAARATGQLIRGGFAQNGTEAADIIAAGFQNGLDIAGDWLDTITEYTTQFRKLGLDGSDALGLIQQGLQGGARDSDKVADSLKEFSIRAVDGSKLTAEGFAALGFQADEMAGRFLAGGDSARQAFGVTLQAIQSLDDPVQQALVWTALFGTQWEDMGDAINSMDLSTARTQFGETEGAIDSATQTLSEHVNQWDALRKQFDVTFNRLKEWLADSAIGRFFSDTLPTSLGNWLFPETGFVGVPGEPGVPAVVGPTTTPGVQGPGLTPGTAVAPPAGTSTPGPQNPLLAPYTPGALPPPSTAPVQGPGLPPPVPGARTPILTDTQQQAADEAEAAAGGGSESLPPAPVLPLQYSSVAGLPTAIANATTRLDEAAHDVAEKEARVNQLRASNVADADDIQTAENALAQAEQRKQQAARSLTEAQINTAEQQYKQLEKATTAMEEFGAELDSDFGISDGLAGIADNLVRFVGALALAGPMAMLNNISAANPNQGSGMLGMLASTGAFGAEYTPAYQAMMEQQGSALGPAALQPGMGGAYGMAPAGGTPRQYQKGMVPNNVAMLSSLEKMYPGLTMSADTGRSDKYGEHGSGQALDIMVNESMALGDQINQQLLANADALGLQYNIWKQQMWYPDGRVTPMEDRGDPTQNHMDHVHARVSPGPAAGGPGGGMPGADWSAMAQAESSGNWQANTGNGYYGGLQFLPSSWSAAGGDQYAPRADLASPQQQVAAAENLLALQGPGAWPNTFVPAAGGGGTTPGMGRGMPQGLGMGAGVPGLPAVNGVGGAAGRGMANGGGVAYPAQGGEGGFGISGMAMDAAMAGTSALDFMAPGAGAAAKVGIQLANLTLKQAGKVAGIGVSGFMETLSIGDNPMGSIGNSWFGKLAGGLAGAKPALPNKAGGPPPGGDPSKQPGGPGGGAQQAAQRAGNTANINITNNGATPDQNGRDVAAHTAAMWAPSGRQ